MDCSPLELCPHGDSPGRETGVSLLLQDLPNPGIEPKCPALQVGSLPYEAPGEDHAQHWINVSMWTHGVQKWFLAEA